MRTFLTRNFDTGKLCAMVKARTYSEALKKTCVTDPYAICRHTKSNLLKTPDGVCKIPNYITFMHEGQFFYMYHI